MLLVFGSVNTDIVMRVARRPAAGETVLSDDSLVRAGGKGANQAVAATRAGASVAIYGAVGTDEFGQQLKAGLASEGVDVTGLAVANRASGLAVITVDPGGENAICVAPGANAAAAAVMVPDSRLQPGTIIVAQMEVPPAENWSLFARAKALAATTLLNLAPADAVDDEAIAAIRDNVDYLVVNGSEAALLAGRCGVSEAAEPAAALARRLGSVTIITRGAEGAVCASPDGKIERAPALPVAVVDSTGAGDTFTGVFAAALDRGSPLDQALREAAVAGSLACLALGAQESMPSRADIDAALGLPAAPATGTPPVR